jgi:hypothetical protein
MAEGPQENPTFAARAFIGGYVLAIASKAADRFDVGSYAQFAAYTLAAFVLAVVEYNLKWLLSTAAPGAAARLNRMAVDPRWWTTTAIVLLAVMTFSPYVEQRRWPFAANQTATGDTAKFTASNSGSGDDTALKSQLADANQRAASLQSRLDAAIKDRDLARQAAAQPPSAVRREQPSMPEDQSPITWQEEFQWNWSSGPKMAWIRFVGRATALAHIKDAYIISDLTGHREQLSVANPINFAEQWKIDEIEPITAGASVMLVYEIQPQLSISDFLSVWGTFELHVIYDDKEYVKKYLPDYINDKMTREMPGIVGPRVTKKPPDK